MKFIPDEPQLLFKAQLDRTPEVLGFVGMGIGKTATVLWKLVELFFTLDARAALIVAPLRVANLTWPLEVKQFDEFNWMRVVSLRTKEGRKAFIEGTAHIYVMNYDFIPQLVKLVSAREKWCHKHGVKFCLPYDVEVWDELTRAKSPKSKRINLFRRKMARPKRRWGLTGTPAPNGLLDLFAQVRLIDDGKRLGEYITAYREQYFANEGYMYAKYVERAGAKETIEGKLADITCTLRSSDWLKIPDTVVEDVEVTMPPALVTRYEELEEEMVLKLREDQFITAANAAVLISKLLQFTSGAIYDAEKKAHWIHDLKLDALKKLRKEIKTPLLVACIFQHEQERIRKAFPEAKFFEDAKTPAQQTALFEKWNRGEVSMLVCHPQSAGHGLNLQHGGSHIIWMSLTYSREMYEQMIARLARRGQKDITRVYRIICRGTADDVVAWALEEKAATERSLIDALMQLEAMRDGQD